MRKIRLITGEDVGTHDVWVVEDRQGKRFIFKPVDSPDYLWRAEVEEIANQMGRMWGFNTPDAHVTMVGDEPGLLMDYVEHVSSFRRVPMPSLTARQIGQVAAEHVLDWMLDNDDTHSANLLLGTDGRVVGIDKGRAFFVYGNWSGITADWRAHSNAQLIYTRLYDDIRSGALTQTKALTAASVAVKAANRIARSDDALVETLVRRATANRPKWSRPGYMTHFTDEQAPRCQDDLVAAVLARKASIVSDIRGMWREILDASPYVALVA